MIQAPPFSFLEKGMHACIWFWGSPPSWNGLIQARKRAFAIWWSHLLHAFHIPVGLRSPGLQCAGIPSLFQRRRGISKIKDFEFFLTIKSLQPWLSKETKLPTILEHQTSHGALVPAFWGQWAYGTNSVRNSSFWSLRCWIVGSWWITDRGSGHWAENSRTNKYAASCTGRVTSKIQFLNWNCPLT